MQHDYYYARRNYRSQVIGWGILAILAAAPIALMAWIWITQWNGHPKAMNLFGALGRFGTLVSIPVFGPVCGYFLYRAIKAARSLKQLKPAIPPAIVRSGDCTGPLH